MDLNFHEALGSYFHLSFKGNLLYPEDCEAIAVWLQQKVAGIDHPG